eukprot:CAMPEP_0181254558 /NCGR_PEP_ID=MMETSP1096-20121128/48678_1 /TAXON_ID=156174 ORGANISM="Chrysochromulina ericina, Strain CCMP281" /NCGR_SAMPLE_ID=MMETSP1096 /ASSEMBLY_ACC=CAM_ASM_000453 /LENGTH=157 /DNA_ID=CAMNT_0023352623 /DNA_START=115 /DNA_END=590 /DNA_ORIENTATION=+
MLEETIPTQTRLKMPKDWMASLSIIEASCAPRRTCTCYAGLQPTPSHTWIGGTGAQRRHSSNGGAHQTLIEASSTSHHQTGRAEMGGAAKPGVGAEDACYSQQRQLPNFCWEGAAQRVAMDVQAFQIREPPKLRRECATETAFTEDDLIERRQVPQL